jgi:hypothetical protein
MTILEAWIENTYPNAADDQGWVLALRGSWDPSTFSSFNLDPNGTPRVVLTVTNRAGFARSGGQAVVTTRTVGIRATDPLRRPWGQQSQIDEADEGEGVRTIRLALEDYVYEGETVTVSVLAGWRAGLTAQTNIPVTNNSEKACPKPWAHWSCPPDQLVDGTGFTPELVCASLFPMHDGGSLHQPVAAVRFTASDGTNSVSAWVTQMTTSTTMDDGLLVWRAPMDLSSFTSGRVTIHAEVYPWVGPMWSTKDAIFSGDHIVSWTVSLYPLPEKPLMITLDKDGTLIPRRHIALAPAGEGNPSASAAACMRNTLAEALAVPLSDRPQTVQRALDLLTQAQASVPAANGYTALSNTRFGMGKFVWVPEGTFNILGNALGFLSGIQGAYIGAQVSGAPGADRDDVVLTHTGTWDQRFNGLRMKDLSINRTVSGGIHGGGLRHLVLENVRTFGTSGNYRSSSPANVYGTSVTKSDSNDYIFGSDLSNTGGTAGGIGVLRSTVNGGSRGNLVVLSGSSAPLHIVWDGHISLNNAHLGQTNGAIYPHMGEPNGTAAEPATRRRVALINCLYERAGGQNVSIQTGEGNHNHLQEAIFDGVTLVGGRWNLHNDPPAGGNNRHFSLYRIGCWLNRNATKHDVFNGSALATGSWPIMHSLGIRDCFIADRIGGDISSNDYDLRFGGINVIRGNTIPGFTVTQVRDGFVADNSGEGAGGGNGDYRLTESALARALRTAPSNYPRDLEGAIRGSVMDAGAFAGAYGDQAPMLAAESAGHGHRAGDAVVYAHVPALVVGGNSAFHVHRAESPAVDAVVAATSLPAASTRHDLRNDQVILGTRSLLLVALARHLLTNSTAIVRVVSGESAGPGVRRVHVRPDPRRVRVHPE